ncbi:MAG: hypothetical protein E7645_03740 [Ruminococcaceae bacterium]|nr:hypothetical protein [Oscillospiraceae bacterium]
MKSTLTVAFGAPIVTTLNEKSAEGYDCLSLTVPEKSKKAELTFAPRAEDGVPYIYRMMEMNSDLFQPEGWNFAFADSQYVYIRRPLPALCHADFKAYLDGDDKELTFLSEKAAEGYLLAAVVEHQYLFVPCPEGETVTYRIDYGSETQDGACYALPEQVDLDKDWMYFICADSNTSPVKYYFASVPLSTEGMPPCGDELMPSELWEDGAYRRSLRQNRPLWGFTGLAFLMALVFKSGSLEWWSFLLSLAVCALIALGCPPVLAHGERKIVRQHLKENSGQVPRASRSVLNAARPTTEEVLMSSTTYLSTGAQKRTLWSGVLILLALALLLTLFVGFGIPAGVSSLMDEGFTMDWLMNGGILLLGGVVSAPLAVVAYVAIFKSLRKIYLLRKKK